MWLFWTCKLIHLRHIWRGGEEIFLPSFGSFKVPRYFFCWLVSNEMLIKNSYCGGLRHPAQFMGNVPSLYTIRPASINRDQPSELKIVSQSIFSTFSFIPSGESKTHTTKCNWHMTKYQWCKSRRIRKKKVCTDETMWAGNIRWFCFFVFVMNNFESWYDSHKKVSYKREQYFLYEWLRYYQVWSKSCGGKWKFRILCLWFAESPKKKKFNFSLSV